MCGKLRTNIATFGIDTTTIMPTFLTILSIAFILVGWLQLTSFGSSTIFGDRLHTVPLPLLARLRMHAVSISLAIGITAIGTISLQVPWELLLVAIISSVLLLAIPVKYTITSAGIRLGWRKFRRWTEFAGAERSRYGATLKPASGASAMTIYLSGGRGDDEFLHLLRTLIRAGYTGLRPVPRKSEGANTRQPMQSVMASSKFDK